MDDKDKGNAFLGLGVVFAAIGIAELYGTSPPSGRWTVILRPVHDAFGPSGLAAIWIVIGAILVAYGYQLRRKK